jgi:hypothetical protein
MAIAGLGRMSVFQSDYISKPLESLNLEILCAWVNFFFLSRVANQKKRFISAALFVPSASRTVPGQKWLGHETMSHQV